MKRVVNRPPSSAFVLDESGLLCWPLHCFIWAWIVYPKSEISSFCSHCYLSRNYQVSSESAYASAFSACWLYWWFVVAGGWAIGLQVVDCRVLLFVNCNMHQLLWMHSIIPSTYAGFDGRWATISAPKTFVLELLMNRMIDHVIAEGAGQK